MSNVVKFKKTGSKSSASNPNKSEGNKVKANVVAQTVEQPKTPLKEIFTALGMGSNNSFCVVSTKQNKLFQLNATIIHSPPQLKSIFGAGAVDEYCKTKGYVKSNGKIDYESLGDEIIDKCQDEGDFDVDQHVRPKGVYWLADSGTGDYAIVNQSNGNVYLAPSMTPIPVFHDGYVYTDNGTLAFNNETPTASTKQLNELEKGLSTFAFEHEFEHIAVLGLALAVIHPSLVTFRPIWTISAEAGSGKTSLLKCLQAIWSIEKTVLFTTEQNSAQLVSTLMTLQPNAILFDECEHESYKRNTFTGVAAIARASYNSRESDAVIRAFQSKHTSIKFQVTTIFSGIQLPQFDEATMSRSIPFKLLAPKAGTKRLSMELTLERLEKIGPGISKLVAEKAHLLLKFIDIARKALSPKMTDRNRDKYSVMCAGILFFHEITKSGLSTSSIVRKCRDFIEVLEARNAADTPDDLVLQTLRNAVIDFGGQKLSFQDLCKQVSKIEDESTLKAVNAQVCTMGIEFESIGQEVRVYVATSKIAIWLHNAFGKAKISASTWRPVLRSAATEKNKLKRYSGLEQPHRSLLLDASLVINQV